MWRILRPFRDAGWHFRRQQSIGAYYADFACLHAGLVIEVDGDTHTDAGRDAERDEYMRGRGLNVLRFTNDDVLQNPDGIHTAIAGVLGAISRASNSPRPGGILPAPNSPPDQSP